MRVLPVPMLQDNYGWLLVDDATGTAAIVDPAEAAPVLAAAQAAGVRLTAIFATHHHGDHVGGVDDLLRADPGLEVWGYAGDRDRIPGVTRPVGDGDEVRVGHLTGRALFVPCHTRGHVAYLFGDALFSGDTLFAGGCGRFFEGSAADMYRALHQVLGALPGDTRVFCGHEYTARNLEFAATLEPSNAAITAKQAEVAAQRAAGRPSVPTTLAEERTYNPFLRVHAPELVARLVAREPHLDVSDPVRVLAAVRAAKDAF